MLDTLHFASNSALGADRGLYARLRRTARYAAKGGLGHAVQRLEELEAGAQTSTLVPSSPPPPFPGAARSPPPRANSHQ